MLSAIRYSCEGIIKFLTVDAVMGESNFIVFTQ